MIDPSSLLGRALAASGLDAHVVGRVELDRDGRVLLQHGGLPYAWVRVAEGRVEQLGPGADKRVPLAPLVDAAGAASRVLAYRPGRRIVVAPPVDSPHGPQRLPAAAVESNPLTAPVQKGYRRGRSAQALARHRAAQEAARASDFSVPCIVASSKIHDTLTFERLFGDHPTSVAEDAECFFRVGHALRGFQEGAGAPALGSVEVFDAQAELAVLGKARQRTEQLLGRLPDGWQAGADGLAKLVPTLPASDPVPTHRDLHDGQLLVARRTIGLLDLDLFCFADDALDAANLTAHLALRALQRGEAAEAPGVQLTCESLLDGLARGSDSGFWERLRFYQATSFLRLALVYAIRPRWTALAEPLTRLGAYCAAEVAS